MRGLLLTVAALAWTTKHQVRHRHRPREEHFSADAEDADGGPSTVHLGEQPTAEDPPRRHHHHTVRVRPRRHRGVDEDEILLHRPRKLRSSRSRHRVAHRDAERQLRVRAEISTRSRAEAQEIEEREVEGDGKDEQPLERRDESHEKADHQEFDGRPKEQSLESSADYRDLPDKPRKRRRVTAEDRERSVDDRDFPDERKSRHRAAAEDRERSVDDRDFPDERKSRHGAAAEDRERSVDDRDLPDEREQQTSAVPSGAVANSNLRQEATAAEPTSEEAAPSKVQHPPKIETVRALASLHASPKVLLEKIRNADQSTRNWVHMMGGYGPAAQFSASKSIMSYGLPGGESDQVWKINQDEGSVVLQTDVIAYLATQLVSEYPQETIRYLEMGVSVMKQFFTISNFLEQADTMCAMELENPNPTVEQWLSEKHEVHEFPSGGLRYSEGYSRGLSAFQRDYLWQYVGPNHNKLLYLATDIYSRGAFLKLKETGLSFNLVVSDARHNGTAVLHEYAHLMRGGFYAEHVTILWDDCLRAVKNFNHPGEDIGNTVRYVIVPHFKQQKGVKVCAAGLKVPGWMGANSPRQETCVLSTAYDLRTNLLAALTPTWVDCDQWDVEDGL